MPNKIQDIIDKFDERTNEFKKDGYETMTIECVRGVLKSSLTSLLDSIEKELPKEIHCLDLKDSDQDYEERLSFQDSHNKLLQEVINIINSHK